MQHAAPEWADETSGWHMRFDYRGFARALLARYGRAQAAADKRDAERWRHARDILTVDDIEFAQSVMGPHGTPDEDESKKADDAIDAALAGKGGV